VQNDENFEGYDAQKCNGLRVKPHQGDAILFYSIFPNNTIDPVTVPSHSFSSLSTFHLGLKSPSTIF
jgi:hypothetical protein